MGEKLTEGQQALIDGVEFGMDHQLDLDPEDVAEYHRLTGSRCAYTEGMEKYMDYLARYAKSRGITPQEADRHLICRGVARECYGLDERALEWVSRKLAERGKHGMHL